MQTSFAVELEVMNGVISFFSGHNMSESRNRDFLTIICASIISVLLLYKQENLQTKISNEVDLLNITKHLNQSILIYNRVPKAKL